MKKIFFFLLSLIFIACNSSTAPEKVPTATLLFSSGFEGNLTIGKDKDGFRPILGEDDKTGFSWPIDIFGKSEETGLHYINENDYLSLKSEIQTTTGHDQTPTKALYSEINCSKKDTTQCTNTDTQLLYEVSNIIDGKKSLYIRYWVKLDATSFQKLDGWRTFFEWKTKTYADGTGFRLISYIYTDEKEPNKVFWHWQGDHDPDVLADWEFDNKEIPVPLNQWFLTEFYWSWEEGNGGRALWKINHQTIKDYTGPTAQEPNLAPALPNQPIDLLILTQIYGDSNPKYQWIDDIEIWEGYPEKYQ